MLPLSSSSEDEGHKPENERIWTRIRRYLNLHDPEEGRLFRRLDLRPIRSEFGGDSCCQDSSTLSASHRHQHFHVKPIRRCFTCKRGFCDNEEHHLWSADLFKKWSAHAACLCSRDCPKHWKGRMATEAAIGAGLLHAETGRNIRFRDDPDEDTDHEERPRHRRRMSTFEKECRGRNCQTAAPSPPAATKPAEKKVTLGGKIAYLSFLPLWLHSFLAWSVLSLFCLWLCVKVQVIVVRHLPWDNAVKWIPYAINPALLPWRVFKWLLHPGFPVHHTIKLTDLPSLQLHGDHTLLSRKVEKLLLHVVDPLNLTWILKWIMRPLSFLLDRPALDSSDGQWQLWKHLIPLTIGLILAHTLLTRTIDLFLHLIAPKGATFCRIRVRLQSLVQALVGIGVVLLCHNILDASIIFTIMGIFYAISFCCCFRITRWLTPWLTWSFCATILILCSYFLFPSYKSTGHHYPLRKLLPILVLKCVSFNIDKYWSAEHKENGGTCETYEECEAINDAQSRELYDKISQSHTAAKHFNILTYTAYCLYAPLYIAGPIVSFQSFVYQLNAPYRPQLFGDIVYKAAELIGLSLLIEFLFARTMLVSLFFGSYGGSIKDSVKAFKFMWHLLSPLEVIFGILSALIYLWLKFKIIWGTFRLWSMLAGTHTPDNLPRFLFNHVSMQDFWRSWHMSYHLWLRRYIYQPLTSTKFSRLLAATLVYSFVGMWHQVNLSFSIWVCVISMTMVLEFSVEKLYDLSYKQRPLPIPQNHFLKAVIFAGLSTLIVQLCMFSNALGYAIGTKGFIVLFQDMIRRPIQWTLDIVIFSVLAYLWSTLILRKASRYKVSFQQSKN